jgi:hypothetical protein
MTFSLTNPEWRNIGEALILDETIGADPDFSEEGLDGLVQPQPNGPLQGHADPPFTSGKGVVGTPHPNGPLQGPHLQGQQQQQPQQLQSIPSHEWGDSMDLDTLDYFIHEGEVETPGATSLIVDDSSGSEIVETPTVLAPEVVNQEGSGFSSFYTFGEEYVQHVKRIRASTMAFDVNFVNMAENSDLLGTLKAALTDTIDKAFEMGGETCQVGLKISHPGELKPYLVRFSEKERLTPDKVLNSVERVLQSNQAFRVDNWLRVQATIIRNPQPPRPGGRPHVKGRGCFQSFRDTKGHGRCYVRIDNDDNLCLARATVTAKAKLDDDHYDSVRKGDKQRYTVQRTRAIHLMAVAGLDGWDQPCGLDQIRMVEAALPQEYQLRVYTKEWFSCLYYPEAPQTHVRKDAPKMLTLYLSDGHFDVITSVPAFFGLSYWCHQCEKGYNCKDLHVCPSACYHCKKLGRCEGEERIICAECSR